MPRSVPFNISKWFRLIFSRRAQSCHAGSNAVISIDNEINDAVVRAFSHGSEPAFRKIYDRYAPAIYRVVLRYFHSSVLAEELLEELFSTLWRERGLYTGVAQLKLRLFATARNLAIQYLEKTAAEMLSVNPSYRSSNEISLIGKKAGLSVNALQHQLKDAAQPPA